MYKWPFIGYCIWLFRRHLYFYTPIQDRDNPEE